MIIPSIDIEPITGNGILKSIHINRGETEFPCNWEEGECINGPNFPCEANIILKFRLQEDYNQYLYETYMSFLHSELPLQLDFSKILDQLVKQPNETRHFYINDNCFKLASAHTTYELFSPW